MHFLENLRFTSMRFYIVNSNSFQLSFRHYLDHSNKEKKEISNLNLTLVDVSLDRPVDVKISARMDGYSVSVTGNIGPVEVKPGRNPIPFDITVNALNQLSAHLTGRVHHPAENAEFDMALSISPFSLQHLLTDTNRPIQVDRSDPGALNKVACKAHLKGNPQKISVSDGIIHLDDSRLNFSASVTDFSKPDVTLDVELDRIDLNRYMSSKLNEKTDTVKKSGSRPPEPIKPAGNKSDYSWLRQLVLNSSIRAGKVKINQTTAEDIYATVTGKTGVFHLNPFTMKLYNGKMSGNATLNVKKDPPQSHIELNLNHIESEPLSKDILEKNFLEGSVNAKVSLSMSGNDAEKMMESLKGNGELSIKNGAVKGIDLVGMVRNTDCAYGFAEKGNKRPETGFSELYVPFTIVDGIFKTTDTRMVSTLIRVAVSGKASLPNETLKFRIEPVVVTTSKTDKEKMKRSEVQVPVLVSGTFSSPKFRPDLNAVVKDKLEEKIFESKKFKNVFKKKKYAPYEDAAKSLLKGLLDDKQ